jgi:ribosomal protein L37AE/L43A
MEPLLECPNCRRLSTNRQGHRGAGRCRACGTHLIASTRHSEAEVRRRLYGDRHPNLPVEP